MQVLEFRTPEGKVYYFDPVTKAVSWTPPGPTSGKRKAPAASPTRQRSTRARKQRVNLQAMEDDDEDMDRYLDLACETCKGLEHEDKMVICDQCDGGYHTFCLSPPIKVRTSRRADRVVRIMFGSLAGGSRGPLLLPDVRGGPRERVWFPRGPASLYHRVP